MQHPGSRPQPQPQPPLLPQLTHMQQLQAHYARLGYVQYRVVPAKSEPLLALPVSSSSNIGGGEAARD
ncbi:hypothetical protein M5D96_001156 [Drosophila gunungcola]|uniref:Uncharacterized protein n=1 Tax=Drosophila gunungcola TaxID=103775 RepID=A0A9P9YXL3_9MUSC|nr:hypothetical protein M5D96_001156 [Drosophila gunungcola]